MNRVPNNRSESLATALTEAFPLGQPSSYGPRKDIYANDSGFYETIKAAAQSTGHTASPGALAIGLTVGNGFMHSIIPETNVDVMITVDIDPMPPAWQAYTTRSIKNSGSPRAFKRSIKPNADPLCEMMRERGISGIKAYDRTGPIFRLTYANTHKSRS